MRVQLLPSSDTGRLARQVVTDSLTMLDRRDLVDDAALVVSELIANGVLHARTAMSLSVEPAGAGIRVAVTDGSPLLPRWGPSMPAATSGRGLLLVERLSSNWGVEPLAGGGKEVWATIEHVAVVSDDVTADDLLDLWGNDQWPTDLPARDVAAAIAVRIEIDVQAMLSSRAQTDDLVRELQLMLVDSASRLTAAISRPAVEWLAQRLGSATEEFHEARRQMYGQALAAAKRGETRTTLHLSLHHADAGAAMRWLEALDEADALTAEGILLLPPFPAAVTEFRHGYIAEIIDQLDAAA